MRIRVKVNASSRSESIRLLEPGFYQIRTALPAEAGKANRRVCEMIAAEFGCAVEDVRIVTGASRPLKSVEVRDAGPRRPKR